MAAARRRLPMRNVAIAGLALWALAVISCTAINRVVVVPPDVPGATFVGSDQCATCHEEITDRFVSATHAKLHVEGSNAHDIGCEACHGPGSAHVDEGGAWFTIANPGRSPDVCFACHLDKRGEFALPHAHPVTSGDVSCSDCHDPHDGMATKGGGAQLASSSDTCLQCHTAQRGPFVFEHEAAREGCVVCHSPHGSVNAKLLKARNQTLCLQCHFQEQRVNNQIWIGGRDHSSFLSRGTCWTAGCHEAVHGSHVNSSLRF